MSSPGGQGRKKEGGPSGSKGLTEDSRSSSIEVIVGSGASTPEASSGISDVKSLPRGCSRGKGAPPTNVALDQVRKEAEPFCGVYAIKPVEEPWTLYKYQVSFSPEQEEDSVKKMLVKEWAKGLGIGYMFKGTELVSQRLQNKNGRPMKKDEEMIYLLKAKEQRYDSKLTLKLVKKKKPTSSWLSDLYTELKDKIFFAMNMEKVDGDFFQPKAAIGFGSGTGLELWPGFAASIKSTDGGIQLYLSPIYKVIQVETVLQLINELKGKEGLSGDKAGLASAFCAKMAKNTVVMTTYNRWTYSVKDLDSNLTPASHFKTKKGITTSYVSYYKNRYGLEIKDKKQPMLVCTPNQGPNKKELCHLVPELCKIVGLTEQMRADDRLMSMLSMFMNQDAQTKAEKVEAFITRVEENAKVKELLKLWGLKLEAKPNHLQ